MPTYDYFCKSCNHVWPEFKKMDNRKEPETAPCPNCATSGMVEQTIAFTPLMMSAALGAEREMRKLNNSEFGDRLRTIHKNSPGSTMNQHSSFVDIK